MNFKVGDIVVSGTESSPVISEIVEIQGAKVFVRNSVASLMGDDWKPMTTSSYEWAKDIARHATADEIDIYLDFMKKANR